MENSPDKDFQVNKASAEKQNPSKAPVMFKGNDPQNALTDLKNREIEKQE